jgi:hypothetical protein
VSPCASHAARAELPATGLRRALSGTAGHGADRFLVPVRVRRVSRTLIDAAFGQRRQLLVGRLLFIERLLQERGGLGVTHRLRPRDERAVSGHLVVFRALSRGDQAGVHRGLVELLFHDGHAFVDDPGDPVTALAPHLFVQAPEHLFQTSDLPQRFLEMRLEQQFLAHMLKRSIRVEEDLIDHLFNSVEKRLARTLLLLARYGTEDGSPQRVVPRLSQEALAEIVGTTRGRVNFFINKFRKLGFIDYNGGITVRPTLLSVVLRS